MKKCPSCNRCHDDSTRACNVAAHQTLVWERDGSHVIGGKCRLDSWIGSGAMGAVYEATHLASGVGRAVKLLRPEYVSVDLKARERFRNEARTGDLLEHKHVVKIFDYGEAESNQPYLVMELLKGPSLRDYRGRDSLPSRRRSTSHFRRREASRHCTERISSIATSNQRTS